jgi:hypothetical protein
MFTWNISPLHSSKFSFEYLLLPPRSAPGALVDIMNKNYILYNIFI